MLRFSWSLVGGMLTGAMPTTSPALRSVWKIIWTKYVLEELATLIIQVAIFTAGSQLDWRETGQLPTARRGLKAALVGNNIILTGGRDASHNILFTSILSWDPVAESWQDAADLAVKRGLHAAVAVPSSDLCSSMLSVWFQKRAVCQTFDCITEHFTFYINLSSLYVVVVRHFVI